MPRIEWADGPGMAEEAEALGIKTDQILGAHDRPYGVLVLWSPEPMGEDDPIMGSLLHRDSDGIYRVGKTGPTGSTLGDLKRKIEADLAHLKRSDQDLKP